MTFVFTDPDDDLFRAQVDTRDDGTPVVELAIYSEGSNSLGVHVPLDKVEELIAGIRDTARQAAGQQPQTDRDRAYAEAYHQPPRFPGDSAAMRAAAVSPTAALLASRCDACQHTLNWHTNYAGCTVVRCVCGRFQPPAEEQPAATARTEGAQL